MELFVQGNGSIERHEVVDFRPRKAEVEVLKNRVVAVRNMRDLDLALKACA